MNKQLAGEYRTLRAAGWHASAALSYARTLQAWSDVGGYIGDEDDNEPDVGAVRLRVVEEQYPDLSYLEQRDVYTERQAKEVYDRANRDGCTGIVGEYFDGDEWVHADSVYGFIGDDWNASGHDMDVMNATLAASETFRNSQLLQGAV